MTELHPRPRMTVPADQPSIGVIGERNGQEVVEYVTDEADLDAYRSDAGVQAALSVIGAWSDLDIDETLDALDRIRHESQSGPALCALDN